MEIRFLSRMEIIMVCPWIFPVSQKKQSPETVMLCSLDTRVIEEIDGVLAINPGSLSYPRQHGRKPSYVILETDKDRKMSAKIKYL